jgi:hypothetical protein
VLQHDKHFPYSIGERYTHWTDPRPVILHQYKIQQRILRLEVHNLQKIVHVPYANKTNCHEEYDTDKEHSFVTPYADPKLKPALDTETKKLNSVALVRK